MKQLILGALLLVATAAQANIVPVSDLVRVVVRDAAGNLVAYSEQQMSRELCEKALPSLQEQTAPGFSFSCENPIELK
jgi:hypothetical protein